MDYNKEIKKIINEFNLRVNNLYHYGNSNEIMQKLQNIKVVIKRNVDGAAAMYVEEDNTIYLDKIVLGDYQELRETIFHELFHLISSSTKRFGLTIELDGVVFGTGLNEGYTELLATRYTNNQDINVSPFESSITNALEDLVGSDNMLKSYISGDIYTMYRKIVYEDKIMTKDELNNLIVDIDYIYENIDQKYAKVATISMLIESILNTLMRAYARKTNNVAEAKTWIKSYVPTNLTIGNKTYNFFTTQKIKALK